MEPSEAEIIIGCLAGNASSQRMLYKRFAGKMFLVCLRYMRSREEAEDILHEGFMNVFEKLRQFKSDGSFEGWIRRIMVNKSIERLRTLSHMHVMINIEEIDEEFISAEDILSSIASKDLLSMIQELPFYSRMVFNMYIFEGMKHKEIAEQLGVSLSTSKSNLSYARTILKRKIRGSIIITKEKNA